MHHEWVQYFGAGLFVMALLHTFTASRLRKLAARYRHGSVGEQVFHLLGEVEVVFGFWSAVLVVGLGLGLGFTPVIAFIEGLNFTEPLFVFAIMTIAATRPVIEAASSLVDFLSRALPFHKSTALFATTLIVGPLLGSFITEPAAMTVTVLILKERFLGKERSDLFKYLTLAAVFVNVSIGGVLTPFAAPPVLMVAAKWNWNMSFMMTHFGWKAVIAVLINAIAVTAFLAAELRQVNLRPKDAGSRAPIALVGVHLFFLGIVVLTAHHAAVFLWAFLFFLGVFSVTRTHQEALRLRESLLVAFFLAGLVVLGSLQAWWLKPLIERVDTFGLFLGATALTSITDNAALTYLGSQVEGLSEAAKYALVAGAVSGGGLTVIANAPNPAGYSLLQDRFGENGVEPLKLLAGALGPTLVAMTCFWLF